MSMRNLTAHNSEIVTDQTNTNLDSNCIFLATTACEEFWDIEKRIVFLGEWCLRYDKHSIWGGLDGHVMESPYIDVGAAHDVCNHVNKIYKQVLPIFANRLNLIHGTGYSSRYWELVIGPWLLSYLHVLFDRYEHVKKALERYPNFSTIVLSIKSFTVPQDTRDFKTRISCDLFNLQIFSKIFLYFGKKFPERCGFSGRKEKKFHWLVRKSMKQKMFEIIELMHKALFQKNFQISMFFKNSYFPKWAEILILFNFRGLALSSVRARNDPGECSYSNSMREKLHGIDFGSSDFLRCVSSLISSDVPLCFVEGFKSNCEKGRRLYPERVKVIFSANAWYCEEVFKCWAADRAEKGTLLAGVQHGGTYGARLHEGSWHETSVLDRFYTWGWRREGCRARVLPMPAVKLVGIKKIGASNSKNGILWATTSGSRYLLNYSHLPIMNKNYLAYCRRFAKALPQDLLPQIVLRAHREDEWGLVAILKQHIADLKLDTWANPFMKSLYKCRIYVCDHLSTTYLEALGSNKPTILFWASDAYSLNPEAIPFFDSLREVGILFDSPEAAASTVVAIYDDVETWWNAPERKRVVQLFCETFARSSPDSVALWSQELRLLSKSHLISAFNA